MRPRAQGQQRKEGSAAPLRSAGVAEPVPRLYTTKQRATDARQMPVWECDLPLMRQAGRQAGSVPELLNRTISALNFEPGSAGTGYGGWDGVALTTMRRMSAIPLTPQVGEHRLGSSQEARKPLYTHILPNFYSWREGQHTSTTALCSPGLRAWRRARPPAVN